MVWGPWGEAGAEPLLGNYFCDSGGPSQPLPRPSAQTRRPSPSIVLLRCSPFPEGWVGPDTGRGSGESGLEAALPQKKTLEVAGCC